MGPSLMLLVASAFVSLLVAVEFLIRGRRRDPHKAPRKAYLIGVLLTRSPYYLGDLYQGGP